MEMYVKTKQLLTKKSREFEAYVFIKIEQSLQKVNKSVTSALEKIESKRCPYEYRIDKGKCYWYKPCMSHLCQHNGKCIVNIKRKATCQCSGDDEYTYSGAHCEHKTKKWFSDFKYVIAAATGWSAAVLLIITVICCMYRWNRVNKKNQHDNGNIQEHETLSYNHPTGLLGRQRVPSNFYLTNASRDDSHFIDYRRRHAYMESNMDINNLSIEPASDVENDIDYVPDFCNNAIFEKEFNIKRPQIRSESIPVFNNFRRPTAYRPDYI